MRDAAVPLGHIDVLKLAVHVVLGYHSISIRRLATLPARRLHTFYKLAAVSLSGVDLNRYLVTLQYPASATSRM